MIGAASNPDWLQRGIEQALRKEAARIVEEETQAAQQRVAERLKGALDGIALAAMANYRMEWHHQELVIRVDARGLTPPTP